MNQSSKYQIEATTGIPQSIVFLITDSSGKPLNVAAADFSGAVNQKGDIVSFKFSEASGDVGGVVMSWGDLPAGCWRYDVFLTIANKQYPLVHGNIIVSGRVTNEASGLVPYPAEIVKCGVSECGEITITLDSATSAEWYAREAAESAAEAQASATQAAESQEAAGKSAEAAADSQEAAARSQDAAASSATTALSAAQQAASSEEDAAASASLAGSSENAASQSASDANQSASQAATSASSSSQSQQAAAASATAAASSASSAQTSQTNASSSASAAATSASSAATSERNAAASATAAEAARNAIPAVDASGNMRLSGGLTASGAINANGGVNIPMAVGAPTGTAAVNRLYAAGLSTVIEAFSPQSFLSNFNLYGGSVAVDQLVPGWCWKLRNTSADPGTVQVNLTNPFLGVGNYSGWRGFILPVTLGNYGSPYARKLTFSLGTPGNVVKKTAAEMDMFTLSPALGSDNHFVRFIDVTFYMEVNASMKPAGYPVRVRELVYDSTKTKWLCYETNSAIPSINTTPASNMFLSYQQDSIGRDVRAGLWIGSNAADQRRLLCIADMHGVVDTYAWYGVGTFYWDSAGSSHSFLGAPRQMTAPGNNQPNGAYAAFRSLETRLIQSTSTYDFTPYE